MIHVLMVGVNKKRVGGMSTVADIYLKNKFYNRQVKLKYIPTSTNGSLFKRIGYMMIGYIRIIFHLLMCRTDLVHIHMAEKGSTFRKGFVAKIARRMNKKVIIHLHAGAFVKWYSSLMADKRQKIKSFFDCADAVVVLGEYWKKELSTIIPEEKITVIYNGTSVPKKNSYSVDSKNITYFGVLKKEKGIYDLLEAIKRIDAKLDKSIKVLLCGKDLEGNLRKKVSDYELNGRVEMLGWVSADDRKELLRTSMVNILPSYYEGLSMTIIEGISYGVPTITTNISTMPEIFGDYKYLIRPGDTDLMARYILELANDRSKRAKISKYVYSCAKGRFSEESFISNTLMLYNEVIGRKK